MPAQIDLFGGGAPQGIHGDDAPTAPAPRRAGPTPVPVPVPAPVPGPAPVPATRSFAEEPPRLLVIDGTALLFRVYYGMPSRRSPSGVEVGAVIGVCHQLLGICRRRSENHIVVVYDAGQETFRNRIDPRYKANRGDPPDDLVPQFDLVKRASAALGFPSLAVDDYEADDLMASLATAARAVGMAARMVAIDKDLLQVITDDAPAVDVCNPKTDALIDAAGVRERLGIRPDQVVDYMAMIGDSTDNVPGIRGVGPKAAQALLAAFDNLDGIFANLGRIEFLAIRGAKALAQRIEAGRDDALLAQRLVRLDHRAPLGLDPGELPELTWTGPTDAAEGLFAELGSRGPLAGFRHLASERAAS